MYLQVFVKQRARLKHLHSFVRENYNGPKVSLELSDNFFVVSETPARIDTPSHTFRLRSDFTHGEELRVFCRVSFSSRGKDNFVKPMNTEEALAKFLDITGLVQSSGPLAKLGHSVRFMGRVAEKRFDIMNAFEITGIFSVSSPKKLAAAVLSGIGARRSYGFGLVLVKGPEE